MQRARVTQKDIARKAGLHRSTVSLIFKNDPSIPAKTVARVKRIAKQLNYVPDPVLSSLAAYRARSSSSQPHGRLAWIANTRGESDWRTVPHFKGYYAGAVARAHRAGYEIETFDVREAEVSVETLLAKLEYSRIAGLLICSPVHGPLVEADFPWQRYSAVSIGNADAHPALHMVGSEQHGAARRIMAEMNKLGYRRIGLAMSEDHHTRTDFNYLAAYLVSQDVIHGWSPVPPKRGSDDSVEALRDWLQQFRPDGLISGHPFILEMLREIDVKVPEVLGVACTSLSMPDSDLAGIYEDSENLGATAADLLIGMIRRDERGVPERQHRLSVEGAWQPGRTLRLQQSTSRAGRPELLR